MNRVLTERIFLIYFIKGFYLNEASGTIVCSVYQVGVCLTRSLRPPPSGAAEEDGEEDEDGGGPDPQLYPFLAARLMSGPDRDGSGSQPAHDDGDPLAGLPDSLDAALDYRLLTPQNMGTAYSTRETPTLTRHSLPTLTADTHWALTADTHWALAGHSLNFRQVGM